MVFRMIVLVSTDNHMNPDTSEEALEKVTKMVWQNTFNNTGAKILVEDCKLIEK